MENKAIINVNIGDTNIDFCYPDSQYMKNIILSVFSGNDYPIIQIPDYSPNIIFDIGANIGAVALYFYAHFPESRIYCYEPLTMNYAYLKENTKYFDKIHTYPFGLYDKSANLPIYLGKDHTAQNSLFKNSDTTDNYEIIKLVNVTKEIKEKNIRNISYLKIDTEGCEVPILNEFLSELPELNIDMIYVEYHSEKDRLEIDQMVSNRFLLINSKSNQLHRGTNVYISKILTSFHQGSERLKIQ